MKFKPIETAPHDGTIVDLWHKGGFRITDQWWVDDEDQWCGIKNSEISHWIEVPESPMTGGE